jgi:hypothetical protein
MSSNWILAPQKMDMDTFRHFLLVSYPFLTHDEENDKDYSHMHEQQMDADEFLFTDKVFYQNIIRNAINILEEQKDELINVFTMNMDKATDIMSENDYLSTCNYLKESIDIVSNVKDHFDGFDVHVSDVKRSYITIRPFASRTEEVVMKQVTEYHRVRMLMRLGERE